MDGKRLLIYTMFVASGMAGLVYEVVWTRLFGQTFGHTVFAVSSVLAVFMAGLGGGAFWFGKWVDRGVNGLRLYGLLEIGIGLCGLLMPLLIQAADQTIAGLLFELRETFLVQSAARVAVAALFLLLPTLFMGGTLPALGKYLTRQPHMIGRDLGSLYAANTAGAVFGAFLAGFVLIEKFGLLASSLLTAGVNLLIGIAALVLSRESTAATTAIIPPEGASSTSAQRRARKAGRRPTGFLIAVLAAYGLSGFVALASEVIWSRALVFFLGNSTYAFSTVLTVFLAGLAVGGAVGARLADRTGDALRLFALVEMGLAFLVLATIPVLWQGFYLESFRQLLQSPRLPWLVYLTVKFLTAALVLFLPAVLFGLAFPLVCRICIDRLEVLGDMLGKVYAGNTLGAILGSLAAGFVLIPAMGLQSSLVVLALLAAFVAIGLAWLAAPPLAPGMATNGAGCSRAGSAGGGLPAGTPQFTSLCYRG